MLRAQLLLHSRQLNPVSASDSMPKDCVEFERGIADKTHDALTKS